VVTTFYPCHTLQYQVVLMFGWGKGCNSYTKEPREEYHSSFNKFPGSRCKKPLRGAKDDCKICSCDSIIHRQLKTVHPRLNLTYPPSLLIPLSPPLALPALPLPALPQSCLPPSANVSSSQDAPNMAYSQLLSARILCTNYASSIAWRMHPCSVYSIDKSGLCRADVKLPG